MAYACMDHARIMHGLCRIMHGPCMDCKCMAHAGLVHGLCMDYVQTMHGLSMYYALIMGGLCIDCGGFCTEYVPDDALIRHGFCNLLCRAFSGTCADRHKN